VTISVFSRFADAPWSEIVTSRLLVVDVYRDETYDVVAGYGTEGERRERR
jgi:hypothetical protein